MQDKSPQTLLHQSSSYYGTISRFEQDGDRVDNCFNAENIIQITKRAREQNYMYINTKEDKKGVLTKFCRQNTQYVMYNNRIT